MEGNGLMKLPATAEADNAAGHVNHPLLTRPYDKYDVKPKLGPIANGRFDDIPDLFSDISVMTSSNMQHKEIDERLQVDTEAVGSAY
jgi:hypothetical protein